MVVGDATDTKEDDGEALRFLVLLRCGDFLCPCLRRLLLGAGSPPPLSSSSCRRSLASASPEILAQNSPTCAAWKAAIPLSLRSRSALARSFRRGHASTNSLAACASILAAAFFHA